MAANTTPLFTLTPRIACVKTTGANTALDGTGSNVVSVIAAGVNGTSLECFFVKALGTSTAGMIRLFVFDGTNYFLFHEIPVSAIVASATVAAFEATYTPPSSLWVLPTGYSIKCTTQNADAGYVVGVTGGDF